MNDSFANQGFSRKAFVIFNISFMLFVAAVTLYPFIYVIAVSFSAEMPVAQNRVWLYPIGFNFNAYRSVFSHPDLWRSYYNTIFYTIIGTGINMVLTIMGAYPLSRMRFRGRGIFSFIIVFTMLFSGGMIPTFLVVRDLGMLDSRWAILLPSAVHTFLLIMMRSFFQQIPKELEEAAQIDGCNELRMLVQIFLPLSTASLATIALMYAVAHWNNFFSALIYLPRARALWPIQILLREIVIQNQMGDMAGVGQDVQGFTDNVRYATIMVAALPILMVYPFIQKYFVKGVMIGAIKG